jgi:xanthine dehydrogenase accessory factor
MSATTDIRTVADRLRADRRPFVSATVVRAERPTSAKAGDTAVVLDDGTIVGFVGGECAQASVQTQALAALAARTPVLLTISPDADGPGTEPVTPHEGAIVVHNPCLSGGTLEIFLEPAVPPLLVVVFGDAPIARSVRELAAWMGYDARVGESVAPAQVGAAGAVVVAMHGGDEAAALRAALDTGVPYVGLVASRRRGQAVLDALDLTADERSRVRSPAGLDIGSHSPEEVALSIMAEVVSRQPTAAAPPADGPVPGSGPGPTVVVDPVCGMEVVPTEHTRHADHDGVRFWFCGSGCEQAFLAAPETFARR